MFISMSKKIHVVSTSIFLVINSIFFSDVFGIDHKKKGFIKLYAANEQGEVLVNRSKQTRGYVVSLRDTKNWSLNKFDQIKTYPCVGHLSIAGVEGCPVGKIVAIDAEKRYQCMEHTPKGCGFDPIWLAPGQQVTFKVSELKDAYSDNEGYVVLEWTIVDK
jgi:hypothetical protein